MFSGAEVESADECEIIEICKRGILKSLEKASNLTEASMFPDFYGFANLHSQHKSYIEPNVQDYLRRGSEAHLEGDFDGAIVYYTEVISLQPGTSTLRTTYVNRALAYNLTHNCYVIELPKDIIAVLGKISRKT